MFEKFTDQAQKVMLLANEEARRLNHDALGSEHILLGLLREDSAAGATILRHHGIELRFARQQVERYNPPIQIGNCLYKLPHTSQAKKVIEYSMEEARNFGHMYFGTEHIMLGLFRDHEGIPAKVLEDNDVSVEQVRKEILQLFGLIPKEIVGSTIIADCDQWLDDEDFYSGPSPTTVQSAIERLKKLLVETKKMKQSLLCIRERAAVFAKPLPDGRPRKSAVSACTWIVSEIDGLIGVPKV